MKTFTLTTVAAALTLGLSAPAFAQSQPATRKVDRNELRYCLTTADTIKSRNEGLKERAAKARAQQEELKAEGDAISAEIKRREGGGGLMTAGNDRIERRKLAYERKGAEVKTEAEALQADADKLTADLNAYNQRCNGISYDKEDREAIDKERAAGQK